MLVGHIKKVKWCNLLLMDRLEENCVEGSQEKLYRMIFLKERSPKDNGNNMRIREDIPFDGQGIGNVYGERKHYVWNPISNGTINHSAEI